MHISQIPTATDILARVIFKIKGWGYQRRLRKAQREISAERMLDWCRRYEDGECSADRAVEGIREAAEAILGDAP